MKKRRRKRKKNWKRIIGVLMLMMIMAGCTYGVSFYQSMTGAVDTMYEEKEQTDMREEEISLEELEPFSVLLLGVDERQGDTGRSDSIMVLAVNPEKESVEMVSIPRDTRTEIAGKGITSKINHAYAYGGVETATETVEQFLDIPIDYFVQINMESFKGIVDALGGVTVMNYEEFTHGGTHFAEGEIKLNGKEALAFSRMRYEDVRGDFGRQTRQREVLEAIIEKGASFSTLTKYQDIFDTLGDNIKTNLTFNQMLDIQKNYRSAAHSIEQIEMESTSEKIYDEQYGKELFFEIISDEEKLKVQQQLKEQLELEQ